MSKLTLIDLAIIILLLIWVFGLGWLTGGKIYDWFKKRRKK
jgi:hypothetical protein